MFLYLVCLSDFLHSKQITEKSFTWWWKHEIWHQHFLKVKEHWTLKKFRMVSFQFSSKVVAILNFYVSNITFLKEWPSEFYLEFFAWISNWTILCCFIMFFTLMILSWFEDLKLREGNFNKRSTITTTGWWTMWFLLVVSLDVLCSLSLDNDQQMLLSLKDLLKNPS